MPFCLVIGPDDDATQGKPHHTLVLGPGNVLHVKNNVSYLTILKDTLDDRSAWLAGGDSKNIHLTRYHTILSLNNPLLIGLLKTLWEMDEKVISTILSFFPQCFLPF